MIIVYVFYEPNVYVRGCVLVQAREEKVYIEMERRIENAKSVTIDIDELREN